LKLTCVWEDGGQAPPAPAPHLPPLPPPPPSPLVELAIEQGKEDGEQLLYVIKAAMTLQLLVFVSVPIGIVFFICCSKRKWREGSKDKFQIFVLAVFVFMICAWLVSMAVLGSNIFGTVGSNCECTCNVVCRWRDGTQFFHAPVALRTGEKYADPEFLSLIAALKWYFYSSGALLGLMICRSGCIFSEIECCAECCDSLDCCILGCMCTEIKSCAECCDC
jgi:hypothetical protein